MLGVETGWITLRIETDRTTLGMPATDQTDASLVVSGQLCRGLALSVGLPGFRDLSPRVLEGRPDEPLDALAVSHGDHRQESYAVVGRRDTKTHRGINL